MKKTAQATILLLLASSVVALAAMVRAAGKFEWDGFYPWVIGPYILLLLIFCFPVRRSRARSDAGCIAAGVVLVFTSFFYGDAMWFSVSSTSGLIFIFAPAYLFAGGFIVWGVAWWLLARRAAEQ